ncbi:MAG TPA: NHL repeat-containing protein [Puia sp.]|nr:NHL repeat-containing protein [Puia sp.]
MKNRNVVLFSVLAALTILGTACNKGNSGGGGQAPPPPENKVTVSTFAGDGTDGYLNGALLSAKFNTPIDVATTPGGVVFVSDYKSHRIRKISGGQVSLFAGNGNWGEINGASDAAEFKDPYRIEVDAAGNVYVLDQNNPHIRMITREGFVAVFAGTGVAGFRDGNALIAQFALDQGGITFDAQGNLYIDDTFNGRIRKISLAGQVSTFAGKETEGFVDGDTSVAQFRYADGILFDKTGNMYVADNGNFCIRKITPSGTVSRFTGTGTKGVADGGAGTAQFGYINDMVTDKDGNIFLSDENRIRKVTPDGTVSTIAGGDAGFEDGKGATARFNYPAGMAIDGEGNIYVADANNNRVRKISFK